MPKIMLKIDTEKVVQYCIFDGFWLGVLAVPGGKGGGRYLIIPVIRIVRNARHPRGAAD